MGAVWKRKIAAICAACLGVICLLAAVSLFPKKTAVARAESAASLNIESNNLSYADSTYLLYAVSHDGFDHAQYPIQMLFWDSPQSDYAFGTENYLVSSGKTATVNDKSCVVFYSQGIPAKQYAELIYARAYVEIDGQAYYSEPTKFGVAEYVHTMREHGGLTEKQVEAFDSLLQYGASVQTLLEYSTDKLATQALYKISVVDGTLSDGFAWGRYALNTEITLTADPAPQEDLLFSHWIDGIGEIVGYSEELTVTVGGENTFTAVYLPEATVTVADFATMNGGTASSAYDTELASANGWTGYAPIFFKKSTHTTHPYLQAGQVALILSGNKTAPGWVQSPVLSGGVSMITLNYGIPYTDTQFSLLIEVTDENGQVTTQTVSKTALQKGDSGALEIVLTTPVQGAVTVKITNGCLSNLSSHTDRAAIWDLTVHGYGAAFGSGVDQFDVHFVELGNYYTGDCTFIKAGDVDILIDAGSRESSAATLSEYIGQYCTDGVLEYVIATHAHQDHIAGFVGSNGDGIFDTFRVGTLFDFPLTNSTSQIYSAYVEKRESIVENYGTKHYNALQWWNETDGLTKTLEIANGITMSVLYQQFYENTTANENDYSVCVSFSQGDNHYLFTGDLEAEGEASLLENNSLPKMKLYKGAHHGSATSNTAPLLAVIQPEIVCVCCCCGSDEYTSTNVNQFPTQTFVDNVAPYTDQIFVTTLAVNDDSGHTVGFASMNGNIVVASDGKNVCVECSNNNTVLKETEWFKANRTWPSGS